MLFYYEANSTNDGSTKLSSIVLLGNDIRLAKR